MDNSQIKPTILARHGFPHKPTCIAFSPVHQLSVIGCENGSIYIIHGERKRIYLQTDSESLTKIIFLKSSTRLICLTGCDTFILTDFAKRDILSKLHLKNEKVSAAYVTVDDQLLFIGTTKGNVYSVRVEQEELVLTRYAIFWNCSCRGHAHTHPGSVIFLSICPLNTTVRRVLTPVVYWVFEWNSFSVVFFRKYSN